MSILLYGCTTWTVTDPMEKKLDGNYTRMLRAILNKSWKQHPTKQQLYGYLLPITKTIKVGQTRYAGHCWRSKDELISVVLPWTPSGGRAKATSRIGRQLLYVGSSWSSYQLEPTYSSSVPIRDVALKTRRKKWTIE